jgi:hypothetical protein
VSFPILQRLIALLGVQPSRPITYRKPSAVTRKPSLEKYDFEDSGQLRELIAEIQRGELPQPRKAEWEPDFGAWGPSETARRLKERMGLKPPAGVGPISQPVVSKRSLHDSLIAEPMPSTLPLYEKASIDFGYNSAGPDRSLIGAPQYLTAEQLPPPTISRRSSYVEDYVIRESFEEFMHGTMGKPTPQPTIKSTVDMRKEKYSFLEG